MAAMDLVTALPIERNATECSWTQRSSYAQGDLHEDLVADISDAVRAEVDKVRELDRSIREYARFLAHVQPLLAARAETRAAEERARERADLEAEEAHRMRVVTAIGVACS